MEVNANGLKKSLYLLRGIPLGPHRGLPYCGRTEVGDGLQILHQQRSRHDGSHVVIIRDLRLATSKQVVRRSMWDIEKRIDFISLDGLTGCGHTRIVGNDP